MLRAEEMPAVTDICDRVDAEGGLAHFDRFEELGEHLQHFNIDDKFLCRGGQAALQPTSAVQEQVGAAH